MKKFKLLLSVSIIFLLFTGHILGQKKQNNSQNIKYDKELQIDTRIDNMGYWKKMASLGLTPVNPEIPFKSAEYGSSKINAKSVKTENSPDIPVTNLNNVTESENSVFIDPNNNDHLLNSNNSTSWSGSSVGSLYGANYFYSYDAGLTWGGSQQGAGGSNSGDPTTAIDFYGRRYVGYIHSNSGQGVSYSDDGINWNPVLVANPPPGWWDLLDKNHLWIDNSPTSSYLSNLYNAWTPFGGSNDKEIEISRSTDRGLSWSSAINISSAVNAGSHNQGVNIQTGPNGEVYVIWAIYDSWPSDETAIGFAKSTNGGVSYEPATRIISNIRGIRTSETSKNMRVNSFPSMAVDISGGTNNGDIYIVWSNIGTPGINTGSDIDVYIIKSTNGGINWSSPIKVNQDPSNLGKEHYFPWITCDPETGILSVIFYDDRNVSSSSCEVFVANSFDGGATWEDFIVSDVSFTPSPIPGLASSYFGDYLGISARGGKVYPCWTDNRTGIAMTYVSPFETNNLERPTDLTATLNGVTGNVNLSWNFNFVTGFLYFNIYRDDIVIGTTTSTNFSDNLPDYGIYEYKVTAVHNDGESIPDQLSVQWGNPDISVDPASFYVTLPPDGITTEILTIFNIGELELSYNINTVISPPEVTLAYCSASGGCDEYIGNVQVGDINNPSGCDGYADYTAISTNMNPGESYLITITNGNPYSADQCGIWIDWNQDEDFDDAGETISVSGTPGNGPYTAAIIPPQTALSGNTTMRIRIMWWGTLDPCGTTTYGEVEDYTINITGWLSLNPLSGTIPANSSQNIDVTFDATGLNVGVYNADILVSSNDPDLPLITIPATLNVSLGNPVIYVDPTFIDFGDVQVGSSNTLQFIIQNTGTGVLSGTITTPQGFTVNEAKDISSIKLKKQSGVNQTDNTLSFNISEGIIKTFDLTFEPTSAQTYNGDVVITHNAGSNPEIITVTGNGLPGPEPDISVNPLSFNTTLIIDGITDEIMQITNTGEALLTYNTNINYMLESIPFNNTLKLGKTLKNFETSIINESCPYKSTAYSLAEVTGDILIDLDVETPTGDNQMLGCEFDGNYIWTTGGGSDGSNKFYKFDISGNLLNTYNQGTSSAWGMRDMAFDGTYLYAGDDDGFYMIDPANGNVTTLFSNTLGLGVIRALAYNSSNGHFYACNWNTGIIEFDANGTQYSTLNSPGLTGMYGLAYDNAYNRLWIFNRTGNPETTFYEYDIAAETLTGVSYQIPLLTNTTDQVNGGAFYSTDLVSGKVVLCGIAQATPVDRLFAMELDDVVTYSWLSITNNGSGSIPGNNSSVDVTVHFDATGLSIGTYNAEIIITSNDPYEPEVIVPVTLQVIDAIVVDIKVFLEGPFYETEMLRFLNTYGVMPFYQPYNTDPWNYNGTETANPIPNYDIVDWILVELRETPGDASTATIGTMIAQQAAFILRNGFIVRMDGSSSIQFSEVITENLYVVIWHRNHLGVMSANALTESGGLYQYDFTTDAGKAYGGTLGFKELEPGFWGMVGGDGDANNQVSVSDKNDIWAPQVGNSGYYAGDFNMNVQVDNTDKLDIWIPNAGKGSQVSDNIPDKGFKCQVPK